MDVYPIKLSYHVNTYAFGERLIETRLCKCGLPVGRVAETWEISDFKDRSGTVRNGSLAGRTLRHLVEAHPDELVGDGWRGPHFPLLAKFLDGSHPLPVHVHADDETARRKYGEPNGKSEAWHILWAGEGASALAGVRPGATADDLRVAFERLEYDAVMPRFPLRAGDTVYVPAGVLHSFGPNTLIFEIQQTSDLAQDVMPVDLFGNVRDADAWTRKIDETLDELRTDYLPHACSGLRLERGGANQYTMCAAGPYFALERWRLAEAHDEPPHPRRCLTLSNVGAPVRIDFDGGSETLERAESCVLPAALAGVRVVPIARDASADLVACYVPDLVEDVVAPLRASGHADDAIRGLGIVGV